MHFQFTLGDIRQVAEAVWEKGKSCKVWAFHGEMGSGKTTFIHCLCEVLQVNGSVGSPTYSIINEYASAVTGTILHMDWYRLANEEEAMQAGVEDALYSGNLCLVEWPDKAAALLPTDTFHLHLHLVDALQRSLDIDPGETTSK